MELNISVKTNNNCEIIISDLSTYLNENVTHAVKGEFRYSDTISIDVLLYNKFSENTYGIPIYTKHDTLQPINLPTNTDGRFEIIHLVLPNKEWFNRELSNTNESALLLYDLVYFSDGENIYKYLNGNIIEGTIEEVLEINTINTTISRVNKECISICYMRKCYINLCQLIFNSNGISRCLSNSKIDEELIYRRDLVWMAINVIKYLVENELLYEAEKIIKIIYGCNGICPSSNLIKFTNGCGCIK